MSNHDRSLPGSWSWVMLNDIGRIAAGGTPSTKNDENFNGDIAWLTPADLSGYTKKYISRGKRNISERGLQTSAAVLLPEGSVLFSSRAPIGYVVIASNPIATNQGFKNLMPYDGVSNEYVYYYLKGSKPLVESMASGTTFLEVSAKRFSTVPIPIAPTNEQHRIVTKIEELFTNLDAGVEALKMVQAQIKRYRQAVLKYAFEGKLTAEWREPHKGELEPASVLLERIREERKKKLGGKYKEPPAVDTSGLPELPDGWSWASLEQLSWDSGYGTSDKCGYENDGIPVVRIPNVIGGEISLDDLKYADSYMQVKDDSYLNLGDMLIVRTNGSRDLIGRAAVVRKEMDQQLFFASYLIRYRILNVGSLVGWIANIWHCPQIRSWIETLAATTAGQYNINIAKLNKLPIAVPPLEEQEHIISEIERRLTLIDAVENSIQHGIIQSARLRQSILKKAFEGKLVPQDPSDEPAEQLLKRIEEEREKQPAE